MSEGQAGVSDIQWIWHELAQNVRPRLPSILGQLHVLKFH